MKKLLEHRTVTGWLLVSPLAAVVLFFLVMPIVLIVIVSFCRATGFSIIPAFEADNYAFLFGPPVTCTVFLNPVKYAFMTWACTLLIGFTIACCLAFHIRSLTSQITLFRLCTIPFWTSDTLRMISWIPFLGRNGIATTTLMS